ncbi:hypothetical protein CP09DC77_1209, partial [Chlamydia psittaci 09DC77]
MCYLIHACKTYNNQPTTLQKNSKTFNQTPKT